jgi:hypothetical protein
LSSAQAISSSPRLGALDWQPHGIECIECWRGRSDLRETSCAEFGIEGLDVDLAKTAGEVLAAVRGATVVDAIVMHGARAAHSGTLPLA